MFIAGNQGAPDGQLPCCLLSDALERLRVPLLIHDTRTVLFGNAACRDVLRIPACERLIGAPVGQFIPEDGAEMARARMDIVLRQDQQLHAVPVRVIDCDGNLIRCDMDSRRIVFDDDRSALIQSMRSLRGRALSPVSARIHGSLSRPMMERRACLHQAGAEAVLVPVLIHDGETVVFANAAARCILGGGRHLEGEHVARIVHPDSLDAAFEHARLVLEHDQSLCDLPLKIRVAENRTERVRVDVRRVVFDGLATAMVTVLDAQPSD